ncbi:MAG TPA: glycosyltransferase [Bacteroidales bacterium]|nr:glycosyltransferase [Bacteroidales bacterium]
MPRVLRIINRFNLGGPTYNAAYLTRYMSPDFQTLLVGGMKEESEENSEFIVRNLGIVPITIPDMHRSINPMKDIIALRKICEIIEDFRPDIVHTHASKAGALGRRAAYKMKVPVIIHTFHGHVFDAYFSGVKSYMYQHIERALARKSTKIIALSPIQRDDLVHKYRICSEDKVRVIPLGFDLNRFRENKEEKRIQFRADYLLDDDEIAIGIVGRIVPIKNHNLFLEGVKHVVEKYGKKIRAFIVGDGEDKIKVMDKCRELGLSTVDFTLEKRKAAVTFTSWIKDVDVVNAGMDIITLTSLNEGTPVSLIEAQASGKPIITTNVGGIENIVMPGRTALLSDNRVPGDYQQKLLTLVEDEQLRNEFSLAGWEFVNQKFSYNRLVSDMNNLYNELLALSNKTINY